MEYYRIFGLMEFTIITSLEAILVVSNILMITIFMIYEDTKMGAMVLILVAVGLFINYKITSPLGRITRLKELVKIKMANFFDIPEESFHHSIGRLQKYEYKRFFLDTIFVFSSFATFRMLPAFILIGVAVSQEKNIGSIASLFLYFNLLHKPYIRLISLYKQAVLYYSQTSLIRNGLEAGIDFEHHFTNFSKGLILSPPQENSGAPLSNGVFASSSIYRDDLKDDSPQLINELIIASKERPILFYTKNKNYLKEAQFYMDHLGTIRTIPSILIKESYNA